MCLLEGIVLLRLVIGEKGKKFFGRCVFPFKLQIIHYAVSLGHHRSLIFYMDSENLQQTSFHLSTSAQLDSWNRFAGEGIFRFSVGLEDADDLIADLEQALL